MPTLVIAKDLLSGFLDRTAVRVNNQAIQLAHKGARLFQVFVNVLLIGVLARHRCGNAGSDGGGKPFWYFDY